MKKLLLLLLEGAPEGSEASHKSFCWIVAISFARLNGRLCKIMKKGGVLSLSKRNSHFDAWCDSGSRWETGVAEKNELFLTYVCVRSALLIFVCVVETRPTRSTSNTGEKSSLPPRGSCIATPMGKRSWLFG